MIGVAAAVSATIVGGACRYRFGSLRGALAGIQGETLLVNPWTKPLGTVRVGGSRVVEYELTNLTAQPVKVHGSRIPCSCTERLEVPDVLPAGALKRVRIKFTPGKPQVSDAFTETITLYTSDPFHHQVELTITARVVPAEGRR